MTPSGVLTGGILIYVFVLLLALLALALVLIAGLRKQRRDIETLKQSPVLKPFPQETSLPKLRPSKLSASERDAVIREAYVQWLQTYVMVDSEPGRAFIYSGVQAVRARGRQTLAATSLGQALGMLIQLSIAGEDPMAQSRFERLYLYLLAHPSAESDDLSAWQSLPDITRKAPADADLNAELLISLTLAAAPSQWPDHQRVYFERAAQVRLAALLTLYQKLRGQSEERALIEASWAFEAAASYSADKAWQDLERGLKPVNDDDVAFWMQLWQHGLDALYAPATLQVNRAEAIDLARSLLKKPVPPEEDALRSYTYADSPLVQIAAAVPLLASLGDQEILDEAWAKLAELKPWRKDGFGASLRLLGLLILAGRFWLPELDWKNLPRESIEADAPPTSH